MSFEGYNQILCENGHLYEYNVYDADNPLTWDTWEHGSPDGPQGWRCPHCGAHMAWWCQVDETNGLGVYDEHGKLVKPTMYPGEVKLEVEDEAHYEERLVSVQVEPPRYKIPKKEGHRVQWD